MSVWTYMYNSVSWKLLNERNRQRNRHSELVAQNQLSVQIARVEMAKNVPSLIWQIDILKDTVKWH